VNRLSAGHLAAEAHAGDVDVVAGQHGADFAHAAGDVAVVEQEDGPRGGNSAGVLDTRTMRGVVRRTEEGAPADPTFWPALNSCTWQQFGRQ